jgi:hypothetical protein
MNASAYAARSSRSNFAKDRKGTHRRADCLLGKDRPNLDSQAYGDLVPGRGPKTT